LLSGEKHQPFGGSSLPRPMVQCVRERAKLRKVDEQLCGHDLRMGVGHGEFRSAEAGPSVCSSLAPFSFSSLATLGPPPPMDYAMNNNIQPPTGDQLKEIIQGPSDVEWRSVFPFALSLRSSGRVMLTRGQIRDEERLSGDHPRPPARPLPRLQKPRAPQAAPGDPCVRKKTTTFCFESLTCWN